MDPLIASLILFAGLILVAAAGTSIAVAEGAPEQTAVPVPKPEAPAYDPSVAVAIFCPRDREPVDIRLGIDRSDVLPVLTVLQCERFGDEPITCDMGCLEAPLPA